MITGLRIKTNTEKSTENNLTEVARNLFTSLQGCDLT